MRVLIADKLPATAITDLENAGLEVSCQPGLKEASLAEALSSTPYQALVVRSTKVNAAMLANSKLGLVVRAGAGVNTIDVSAASEHGIFVANCPGRNSLAVAELAIGLLIGVDRRIPDATADLRAGRWRKAEYSKAGGLAGRTLVVVGAGRIGLEVARRARALEMKVLAWNVVPEPRAELESMGAELVVDLHQALKQADAVSLHLAAVPATRNFADQKFFAALKDGCYFINTSRAEVVDQQALQQAIEERGLRAGLDVFDGEISGGEGEVSDGLLALPGVIATPHIGASTQQAQEAVADEAVRLVLEFSRTGRVLGVNEAQQQGPGHLLVVRHRNEVGVLALVFSALRDLGINVAETENLVFSGGSTCLARMTVDRIPDPEILTALSRDSEAILSIETFSGGA